MKPITRSIIALILSIIMLASCTAQPVSPTETDKPDTATTTEPTATTEAPSAETPKEQFEFEAGTGGLIVTKYTGSDKKVIIPSIIDNKKVVDLNEDVFGGNIVLEEIVLSEYMEYINLKDFAGCDNLVSITYPAKNLEGSHLEGPDNLEVLKLPNAEYINWETLRELRWSNNKLRTFDLSSLPIEIIIKFSSDGLNLILSEDQVNGILSSVGDTGYVYEEFNVTLREAYDHFAECSDSTNCTKNHYESQGVLYHVDFIAIDRGIHFPVDDYNGDYTYMDIDSRSLYALPSEATTFETGLKGNIPFSIHDRTYKQYKDYTLASALSRFWYEEILKVCAIYIFGGTATVSDIKNLIYEAKDPSYNDYITLCTVKTDSKVFECIYGHEFHDAYNAKCAFLARRMVGSLSDVNVAMTYALGCSSITINGTNYEADFYTDSFPHLVTAESPY